MEDRQSLLVLLLIFAVLAAGILAAGILYYREQEQSYKSGIERQLAAIADLKVSEILRWRQERLSDANAIFNNPAVTDLVRNYLEHPADKKIRAELKKWIDRTQVDHNYDLIRLLDTRDRVRISSPDMRRSPSAIVIRKALEALRSGRVKFLDFYRSEYSKKIYLGVLVPILDSNAKRRPIGVLVLRINPESYLYPFINRWPGPSKTAETLLVRREGNKAVFLNELRFKKNTALTLRVSLNSKNVPAVNAALGREGNMEGIDYRGMPVLAATRHIPNSPWFLVARMDAKEVYAPLRERLWVTVILMGTLLIGSAAGVGLVWRHQTTRFYREMYEAEWETARYARRHEFLTRYANDMILLADRDGAILDANERAIAAYGYTREEMLELNLNELWAPESLGIVEDHKRVVEKDGGSVFETVHRRKDGSVFSVQISCRDVDVEGERLHQSIIRDITERKQAEEELRYSNIILSTEQEATLDGILIVDPKGKMIKWNQRFVDMWGVSSDVLETQSDELAIKSVLDKLADPEQFLAGVRRLYEETNATSRDEVVLADGRVFDRHSAPMIGEDGRNYGRVWYFRDITERIKAEADLKRSNEELQQFAYVASHDLREPLRMISSYLQLLERRYKGKLDADADDYIDYAVDGAKRLDDMINGLLEVSRVESSGIPFAPVDCEEALRTVLSNLEVIIKDSGAEITYDPLPMVLADPLQMVQLLQNLIANAIKYRGEDPPRIHVSANKEGGNWVFSVRDNGIGIDPNYSDKLFTLFHRLGDREKYPGVGIGLTTCRKIVERHGGRIWVESEEGKGSIFRFTIPSRGSRR